MRRPWSRKAGEDEHHPARRKKVSKETHSTLIGFGISIFVGGSVTLIRTWLDPSKTDAAVIGISIGILTFIVTSLVKLLQTMPGITQDISSLRDTAIEHSKGTKIKRDIMWLEDFLKNTAKSIMREYDDFVTTDEYSFKIRQRSMNIIAYRIFWSNLVAEQRDKGRKTKSLEARITHSTPIEFWESTDASELLFKQAEFVKFGGKISRIIEGKAKREDVLGSLPDVDKLAKRYREVIEKMRSAGISVFYVENHAGSHGNRDFNWIYNRNIVMQWYKDKSDNIIELSCRDSEIRSVRETWDYLMNKYHEQNSTHHSKAIRPDGTAAD